MSLIEIKKGQIIHGSDDDVKTIENTSVLTTQANEWVENYDFSSDDKDDDINSYKEHTLPPIKLN